MLLRPQFCGAIGLDCSFNEVLAVSGAGAFTFDEGEGYLYVTDEGTSGDSILKIYDMTDPFNPSLESTTALPTDANAREPRIYGNHLYIPYKGLRALAIWDVTDKSAPALLGSVELEASGGNGPTGVAVIGDIACVCYGFGFADHDSLYKVDVSDPENPTVVATLRPYHPAFISGMTDVLAANGNFVVTGQVTGGSSTPFVATVDPVEFETLDAIAFGASGGSASRMAINEPDGSHVYVFNGTNNQLQPVDISDADNLVVNTPVSVTTGASGAAHALCAIAAIDRLYLGKVSGADNIHIFDIAAPAAPDETGTLATGGETVSCIRGITGGCAGFAWGQGTGAAVHLVGTAPLS